MAMKSDQKNPLHRCAKIYNFIQQKVGLCNVGYFMLVEGKQENHKTKLLLESITN